ncbi:MBL fold metallo-hydrolase [Desulfobacterales bacterium HSG17]|nr:MBL fold metallo-hydrolase [Desulfobacterales bacterium HSG17]
MENITKEIFQVGGSGITSSEDAAIYLINFNGHAALVDAGCGYSVGKLLKNIRACGVKPPQVEYMLTTHCHFDHTGGVNELKKHFKFKTAAHELDAPFLESGDNVVTAASWYGSVIKPFNIDIKFSGDRQTIELGNRKIDAIHIPGHSPGSLAYLTESEGKRVIFAQDVHGPLADSLLSDEIRYKQSLELLAGLEADILCEGHYGIYKGRQEIKKFIESFIQ